MPFSQSGPTSHPCANGRLPTDLLASFYQRRARPRKRNPFLCTTAMRAHRPQRPSRKVATPGARRPRQSPRRTLAKGERQRGRQRQSRPTEEHRKQQGAGNPRGAKERQKALGGPGYRQQPLVVQIVYQNQAWQGFRRLRSTSALSWPASRRTRCADRCARALLVHNVHPFRGVLKASEVAVGRRETRISPRVTWPEACSRPPRPPSSDRLAASPCQWKPRVDLCAKVLVGYEIDDGHVAVGMLWRCVQHPR